MPDVRVSMDGPTGVVEVDGHDISHYLRSLSLEVGANELPRFMMEVVSHRQSELEILGAEVNYYVLDDPAGWLRSIDPKLLERKALEGAGMGDPASAAELILKALIAMAEGLNE